MKAASRAGVVDRFSQHRVCDSCSRSFDELAPHHFSFNSPLGWCPVCQGLGVQQGANPAVLVPDGRLSLRKGAVAVWPDFKAVPLFARMIEALPDAEGIDLDAPFDDSRRSQPAHHPAWRGDSWYRVASRVGEMRKTTREWLGGRVFVSVQGLVPGARGSGAGVVRLPLQASGHG